MSNAKRYVVGIDVGSFSVGLAAIEVDKNNTPVQILNAVSHIHDSGLDPNSHKSATSRIAASGVARRTRRIFRKRRRRLQNLDKFITKAGWPLTSLKNYPDPHYPWKVRAEIASTRIDNDDELYEKLSIALRHIARHRGWRNPYQKVRSLYKIIEPSSSFLKIKEAIEHKTGFDYPTDITVGQIIAELNLHHTRLRGPEKRNAKTGLLIKQAGIISARLEQTDHAREIHTICERQGLDIDLCHEIMDYVFAADSPKGAANAIVGNDPIPGQSGKRALKASDAFQRYRIVALLGNLRIKTADNKRPLSKEERQKVYDHLVNFTAKAEPNWQSVADLLEIDRGCLVGTATMLDDGERAGNKPPVHETSRRILNCSVKSLAQFWQDTDEQVHNVLIKALSNSEMDDFDSPAGALVQTFFMNLTDDEQSKLDNLKLPIGRAAYSEDSIIRLTKVMLEHGVDLYTARRMEFGVSPTWTPPAPDVAEPIGHPAVDRVLKIVGNWLEAIVKEWGNPQRVTIEHVRDGFMSEAKSRELQQDIAKRTTRNMKIYTEIQTNLGIEGVPSRTDIWRYLSIQRQNGQCAYCGEKIDFKTAELDHIVPRAGVGCTNVRENLLAVCHDCNLSKSNIPFAVWAANSNKPGVGLREALDRLNHWNTDAGMKDKEFKEFKTKVANRIKQTVPDEELDSRSIESVAWMANELRARIAQKYNLMQNPKEGVVKVNVFRGEITAIARLASGIENKLRFIGGTGKNRLDRRHHAVDAAVIAMMRPYVAQTLVEQRELKQLQEVRRENPTWKHYRGNDPIHRQQFGLWHANMQILAELLQAALDADTIPVINKLRLRLGNGRAHEDTIRPLTYYKVGAELSAELIDRAANEAIWCALTRHPDFDPKRGLPADDKRTIRVHSTHLQADDSIAFFPVTAAAITVRGGYAELGSAFHHARIYKVTSGKKSAYCMIRVYTIDLLPYRKQDLFIVDLPPHTMSMRQAEPKLRLALANGQAEYLGWIVVDDEILVDTSSITTPDMIEIRELLGPINRWRVDGFFDKSRIRLRPRLLSKEGLDEKTSASLHNLIDTPGWRPAVNVLFSLPDLTVVRRNTLGQMRFTSKAHLPISWKVE